MGFEAAEVSQEKKKKSKKQQKSFGAVKTIQLPKSKFLFKFLLDKEKKKEKIHHFRSSQGVVLASVLVIKL